MMNLVTLNNGLLVTPWHPVVYSGYWRFPATICDIKNQECEAVYSLVLDNDFVVEINGYQCICLGHNYTHGILKHDYWGNPDKVINDLKKMPGWDDGLIELHAGCVVSDGDMVTGLTYNSAKT